MKQETPATCASGNVMTLTLILNAPLKATQTNTTVQNFSVFLTTKDLAW